MLSANYEFYILVECKKLGSNEEAKLNASVVLYYLAITNSSRINFLIFALVKSSPFTVE